MRNPHLAVGPGGYPHHHHPRQGSLSQYEEEEAQVEGNGRVFTRTASLNPRHPGASGTLPLSGRSSRSQSRESSFTPASVVTTTSSQSPSPAPTEDTPVNWEVRLIGCPMNCER